MFSNQKSFKTVDCRMMVALDALCQMRKSRGPVTCQSANLLSGETGAYVQENSVEAQAPIPGLVTVFLQ